MTKKEKIIKWLKDKGVFEKFCKNFPNQVLLLDVFLISEPFSWDSTPEGYDFWLGIHKEYYEWYREHFPDEFVYVNFKEIK